MATKLTRRQLAIGAAVLPVVVPAALSAQTTAPAPAPAATSPEDEFKAAQTRNREMSDALSKVQLPQSTEPAFVFKP